ncbi:hypothetical protein EVAR_75719_1 [Eumeta japonica]|uniref:Uncharacterized protein n=1 Tax=Eumeta variegata TaxID=151549 RepID=A0A4C1W1Y4_EUMVA|nr:hypothetical protein EVAR_75719_1 [Eumeta japonica]
MAYINKFQKDGEQPQKPPVSTATRVNLNTSSFGARQTTPHWRGEATWAGRIMARPTSNRGPRNHLVKPLRALAGAATRCDTRPNLDDHYSATDVSPRRWHRGWCVVLHLHTLAWSSKIAEGRVACGAWPLEGCAPPAVQTHHVTPPHPSQLATVYATKRRRRNGKSTGPFNKNRIFHEGGSVLMESEWVMKWRVSRLYRKMEYSITELLITGRKAATDAVTLLPYPVMMQWFTGRASPIFLLWRRRQRRRGRAEPPLRARGACKRQFDRATDITHDSLLRSEKSTGHDELR